MHELYVLTGIITALLLEIIILKKLIKNIPSEYLIALIIIILLVLLSCISVYFTEPPTPGNSILNQNGSIFTIIGAVFTAVNTVVVIYLMIWLHRKETNISLISYTSELRKDLIEIKKLLLSEVEYFEFKQSDHIDRLLYEYQHDPDGNEHLYEKEIENLSDLIHLIKRLYSIFIDFKKSFYENENISLEEYRSKSKIINSLHENIILNRPSIEYAKIFNDGHRNNAEPEDMIEAAKINSVKYITEMIELLEHEAP